MPCWTRTTRQGRQRTTLKAMRIAHSQMRGLSLGITSRAPSTHPWQMDGCNRRP